MTKVVVAALLAASMSAGAACAQDVPWKQYAGLTAIEIPYANGPIGRAHVPQVYLGLRGAPPRRFGMDTGSTGIVVAAEHFIPGPGDVEEGPGQLTYNSSGRVLHGTYWTTDVAIHRDPGTPVATARVPVLRVTRITCLARARDCRPEDNPRGVAFMGIGFDRGSSQGTGPGEQRNPFVNLSGASKVRPGYIVTRNAVHLGMTPDLARNFVFEKLAPNPATGGWRAASMTVEVNGISGDGTILPDTGINYMFLSPPPGSGLAPHTRAPDGTRIAIYLSGRRAPQATYSFTVGDFSGSLESEKVEVVHDPGVFVNTGRMFFEGFDYLYDAAGGYVGYRPR